MARDYAVDDITVKVAVRRHNTIVFGFALFASALIISATSLSAYTTPLGFAVLGGLIPSAALFFAVIALSKHRWIEHERAQESARRAGKPVLGSPPNRHAFDEAKKLCQSLGKSMIDRYLVGFEVDTGNPIWVSDDDMCGHGAVFAKTGVGKTLWLEGLMFQQMARGRASGLTFIDAKRDPGTLADIIMMGLITGRIEDVIVVDPFDPVCAYNFVFTTQRPDVKARKVLRCGLPPTSDQSTTKHYDRLAADAVYRVVRAMESLGLAWSVRDIAVALSAFTVAYPRMRELLHEQGAKQAMVELGHLAGSYRTAKGSLDSARLTDNLRGIASELHSIANSEAGEMFCVPRADLSLTDAILSGKIIYYMLPRLEEAESAARMVKVFREDLEVSIGEITSSRIHRLEDPHLVIIDEGASTFGPTWANLFELARKGRFSLLFGAQSVGGLMDAAMGLSEQFYERVIANVNLKVIMRLGDNRTADDMAEWIGKINTTKKTIATGISSSLNARELTKHIELNRRTADGIRDGFTFAEDEKDLVSPEELKHEMSAEKGLAWFDKGDGLLRKGRSIWFDSELPSTWEGREFLTRYESVEADEIGLAEWVDEHILTIERAETRKQQQFGANGHGESAGETGANGKSSTAPGSSKSSETEEEPEEESGPFRLNLLRGFRGMGRSRTVVADTPAPSQSTGTPPSGENKPSSPPPPPKPEVTCQEGKVCKDRNASNEAAAPPVKTRLAAPQRRTGLSFKADKSEERATEEKTSVQGKSSVSVSNKPEMHQKQNPRRGLTFGAQTEEKAENSSRTSLTDVVPAPVAREAASNPGEPGSESFSNTTLVEAKNPLPKSLQTGTKTEHGDGAGDDSDGSGAVPKHRRRRRKKKASGSAGRHPEQTPGSVAPNEKE
jgi:hypothetical protein